MSRTPQEIKALFGSTLNEDGTLRAVSASSAGTFEMCGLKWYYDKKAKLPKKPMGKGAKIGSQAHDRLDHYLTTGQDVRGPLELVGAAMLEPYLWAAPFNKGPGLVEGPILNPQLMTPGGIRIVGFFDYYVPGTGASDPVIIDHKFKKDLAKWGITEDELRGDPQTLVYGAWVMAREPDAPGFVMRHHQHQTEGEGGRFQEPVEVRMSRDDVLTRFGALSGVIDTDMAAAARVEYKPGGTPAVPYNTEACGAFGGCDFARVCPHSPQNRFIAALRGGSPTAIHILETQYKKTVTTEVTAMGLLAQAAALDISPKPTIPMLAIEQCTPGGVYMLPGGDVGTFEGVIGSRYIFRKKDKGLADASAGDSVRDMNGDPGTVAIHVPPSAPPVAPQPSAEKEEKKRKLGIVDESTPNPIAPKDTPPPTPVLTAAPAEVVVRVEEYAIEKPRRGRPTNAEREAKAAVEPTPAAPTAPAGAIPGFFLLIDCACAKATDLSPYVAEIAKRVAETHNVADVRLSPDKSTLDYGRWKAVLGLEALKNPPKGLCVINSGELSNPVIEALSGVASLVVRGGIR